MTNQGQQPSFYPIGNPRSVLSSHSVSIYNLGVGLNFNELYRNLGGHPFIWGLEGVWRGYNHPGLKKSPAREIAWMSGPTRSPSQCSPPVPLDPPPAV
eukprot:1184634-Prorocentrum_minimum.AAC.5